ncbi:MAG: tetratricopeptide repeat protein [Limisphaerales bacterium]
MKQIFSILFTVIFTATTFAADVAADFSAANKLYARGKFSEAAGSYGKMIQAGAVSPALLFNCGNAEFKSGHLGKAIVAYQQAAQLAPRDAELRANLGFVRNQVQGASRSGSRWQNGMGVLTLNESTMITMVLFWLTLGMFAVRQLRPILASKLQSTTRILIVLTIIFITVLGVQAGNHFSNVTAVVVADGATARSGPFDDAQSVFIARDGSELSMLNRSDGWVQVVDGTGKSGWLPAKQVEILHGT